MADTLFDSKDQIVQRVLDQLQKQNPAPNTPSDLIDISKCGMTEFVGVSLGDTIGLVIANLDESIHEKLGYDKKYRSLGILSARSGGGPQAMAGDAAVKVINTEILAFELPRDTKGGGGHGSLMILGAEEVSDARRAIEIALNTLPSYFGDVYMSDAGHLEMQYTARASQVLEKCFNATLGKAWGLIVGCPAGIGMLMADAAVKAADVKVAGHGSPNNGLSFTNEFAIMITGDSGAVKQAVIAAREAGLKLLSTMEGKVECSGTPYIY